MGGRKEVGGADRLKGRDDRPRPDHLIGAEHHAVAVPRGELEIGLDTNLACIAGATMMTIPSPMIWLSLALPPTMGKWLNVLFGVVYSLILAATMVHAAAFYLLLGAVEIALTLTVATLALRWPKTPRPAQARRQPAGSPLTEPRNLQVAAADVEVPRVPGDDGQAVARRGSLTALVSSSNLTVRCLAPASCPGANRLRRARGWRADRP